ncbi:MAG: hypothetical protein V3T23_12870 [Nitrososphaerales archaeon]
MIGKGNTLLVTILFVFLIAASAYGQCHLVAAHADSETDHEEQLLDCPHAYLSSSTAVILQGRSSGSLASIDALTTIDTNGQAHIYSFPFKYKLFSAAYAFRDRYLWIGVLRF